MHAAYAAAAAAAAIYQYLNIQEMGLRLQCTQMECNYIRKLDITNGTAIFSLFKRKKFAEILKVN